MDYRFRNWMPQLLGSGLLVGALASVGCGASTADGKTGGSGSDDVKVIKGSAVTALLRAKDCPDLRTKIQDDAVMKVKLAVALAKELGFDELRKRTLTPPTAVPGVAVDENSAGAPVPATGESAPSASGGASSGTSGGDSGNASKDPTSASEPTSASATNTQVEGVDEADFVKVVDNGKFIFLLQGSRLYKLKSWPAAATALDSASLKVEGQPSEMFVTDDGKAVIFSSVNGYTGKFEASNGGVAVDYACAPYGGCYYGGGNFTKITVADVSGTTFKTVRELYYEGWYVSSRRYATDKSDVVRAIMQAQNSYSNLFTPQIQWYDAWGRLYDDDVLDQQLEDWAARSEASIRNTKLTDWLPLVQEAKDGKLADVEPSCDGYYVPQAGLSEYGLTHVLSLDVSNTDAPIGGVTIMGSAQTVYSNLERMVLAQPDYRWGDTWDFGYVDQQRTALHAFSINGADTQYEASGWVPGFLPQNNPQFGIDEQNGVIRVATTGWVRDNPEADPSAPEYWKSHTENRVLTLQQENQSLKVAGKTDPFGKSGESITAARFVGDRGYVVSYKNTDPLFVLDVSKADAPRLLGDVEIPGFSQYVHPLDDTHLITLGTGGSWGAELQLFDVSDPLKPSVTDKLDFGDGSSSEGQYNHKAFTFYKEKNLLALPLYSYQGTNGFGYTSTLQVIKVDAKSGFDLVGAVDHAPLFQAQGGCVVCNDLGNGAQSCYYQCSYQPEMRRGHFVSGDSSTFVYAVSYAGVTVSDVSDVKTALATVTLPAPQMDYTSWYGGLGGGSNPTQTGSAPSSGGVAAPPSMGTTEPTPAVDAGSATSSTVEDAGVATGP